MDKKYTLIKCGKLYDGLKNELQENIEILVEDKCINSVGHNLPCPEGTETIDLTALTVTPGLIDAHVHPQYFHWKDVYADIIYNSPGYRALATYHTAQKALSGGFTTIRSVGWFCEAYELDVKRAINEGYLPGSRMIVAPHILASSGSHGDLSQVVRSNPALSDFIEAANPGTGNTPDFFRAAVRREKKLGADFIKIMATGGFATPNDDPDDIQMSDDEFKAIFDTARELKISVTAHVYGPQLMQKMIGYNITGMEHGSLMDKETAHMFEETGTYLVPTFCPYQDAIEGDEASMQQKSKEFCRKLHVYQQRLRDGRENILDSKIKLGYGTDFVAVHNNYESGWEYSAWLRSGADPFRALQAATKNNAEICEIDKLTGTIEPGKMADISGWARDLLHDEDALRDCAFVMKEGTVYETESHMNVE